MQDKRKEASVKSQFDPFRESIEHQILDRQTNTQTDRHKATAYTTLTKCKEGTAKITEI